MNTLITSGNNIQLSQTKTYTLLEDEVFINNTIHKKANIEISIINHRPDADQLDVNVGIKYRGDFQGVPAYFENYKRWTINGETPDSLADLVETINTEIK